MEPGVYGIKVGWTFVGYAVEGGCAGFNVQPTQDGYTETFKRLIEWPLISALPLVNGTALRPTYMYCNIIQYWNF